MAQRKVTIADDATQPKEAHKQAWTLPPRYQIKEFIGVGAYGAVCEAYDVKTKRNVAIKKTSRLAVDSKCVLREIAILSEVHHDNIVRVYDLVAPDLRTFDDLYLVMEICDSDMKELCAMDCTLESFQINTLLYRLLVGLNYLHSAGIYHRDLKPANVLLNRDCSLKIADFGLSRAIGADVPGEDASADDDLRQKHSRCLTEHVVTRWYRGPELILLQQNYTEAIDIWSVGCIYAELLGLLDTAPADRRPLFPGASCFPLSPDKFQSEVSPDERIVRKDDQLSTIFDVIGTPSDTEIEDLEREEEKKYLQRFPQRKGAGFRKKFPRVASASVDLLEKMLRFSPSRRISVAESLEHRLFAEIREPETEVVAPSPVTLGFEREPVLDEARLLHYFNKEIQKYHPEIPELYAPVPVPETPS